MVSKIHHHVGKQQFKGYTWRVAWGSTCSPGPRVTSQAGAALRRSPATGCRKKGSPREARRGIWARNYWWKITIFNGTLTINWAIFNSYVSHHQRVMVDLQGSSAELVSLIKRNAWLMILWGFYGLSSIQDWLGFIAIRSGRLVPNQQKYGRTEVLKIGSLFPWRGIQHGNLTIQT